MWQPIETAPKDGTPVLLSGGQDSEVKYVNEREEASMRTPCRAWWSDGNGWVITVTEAGCCCVTYENPTHWQPLPAPPK